ncbi:low temperature requirement protein A [Kitasatospora sp. NPDC048540]|uniref:low temperature requirement protein A n=1 Tax=Kitasatospora sp. NPDC048540 TaxID=3155634 RepID=UPI0033C08E91
MIEDRRVGWLELFYDLMFVALVAQLAHPLVGDPSFRAALTMLALFAPVWWVWVSSTVYTNLFGEGGAERRVAVMGQMAVVLVMAAGAGDAAHGRTALFAGSYVAVLAGLLLVRWLLGRRHPRGGSSAAVLISMTCWAASIPLHPPLVYPLWAAGTGVEIATALYRRTSSVDVSHLVDRFGGFIIIVLGEGVAQLVSGLVAAHSTPHSVATAVAAFAVLCAVCWIYFDFGSALAASTLRNRPHDAFVLARRIFMYGHFLPAAALMTLVAGLGTLLGRPSPGVLWLMSAALMIFLCNNAFLAVTTVGQQPARVARWLVPSLALLTLVGRLGQNLDPALQAAALFAAFTTPAAVNRLVILRPVSPRRGA